MIPPLEIYVDGQGSVFRTAERCYVRITIAASSTNQSEALQRAQSTVATLTSKIRTLATKSEDGRPHPSAGVTAFTVTPLTTLSTYQRDAHYRELRELPKEHLVRASAEVIFRDSALLADVSTELANTPYLSISGTEWKLTETTRAEIEREARVKAVKDAVQKAEDYAGVVGRRVVAVEIKDQPASAASQGALVYGGFNGFNAAPQSLMQQQQQQQLPAQQGAALAATTGGPALEPKTITVSAHVRAKFVSVERE